VQAKAHLVLLKCSKRSIERKRAGLEVEVGPRKTHELSTPFAACQDGPLRSSNRFLSLQCTFFMSPTTTSYALVYISRFSLFLPRKLVAEYLTPSIVIRSMSWGEGRPFSGSFSLLQSGNVANVHPGNPSAEFLGAAALSVQAGHVSELAKLGDLLFDWASSAGAVGSQAPSKIHWSLEHPS